MLLCLILIDPKVFFPEGLEMFSTGRESDIASRLGDSPSEVSSGSTRTDDRNYHYRSFPRFCGSTIQTDPSIRPAY
jgi:hypothetical protein